MQENRLEEVVLIKASGTALQAKVVLAQNPKAFGVILHSPAGNRHEKQVRIAEKSLLNSGISYMIPDLRDDNEGTFGSEDIDFLIDRSLQTIAFFLQKSGANSVQIAVFDAKDSFVTKLLEYEEISRVFVIGSKDISIYYKNIANNTKQEPLSFDKLFLTESKN